VTTVINEAVVFFGLDDDFMTHSLRLGGITAKCKAGCNPSETRKVAGYKDDSKVMEIYNRINTQVKGASLLASVDDSVSQHHSQGDSFEHNSGASTKRLTCKGQEGKCHKGDFS
jgi:hypothetical protein